VIDLVCPGAGCGSVKSDDQFTGKGKNTGGKKFMHAGRADLQVLCRYLAQTTDDIVKLNKDVPSKNF
jgi:hypothetical protein